MRPALSFKQNFPCCQITNYQFFWYSLASLFVKGLELGKPSSSIITMKKFRLCLILLSSALIATTTVRGIDDSDWKMLCPEQWEALTNCFNETVPSVTESCLSCISTASDPEISTEGKSCSDVAQSVCNATQDLCKSECGSCHDDMVDTYLCHFNQVLGNSTTEFSDCNPVLACGPSSPSGSNTRLPSGHVTFVHVAASLATWVFLAIS